MGFLLRSLAAARNPGQIRCAGPLTTAPDTPYPPCTFTVSLFHITCPQPNINKVTSDRVTDVPCIRRSPSSVEHHVASCAHNSGIQTGNLLTSILVCSKIEFKHHHAMAEAPVAQLCDVHLSARWQSHANKLAQCSWPPCYCADQHGLPLHAT